ncbi:MAG: ECF-type sigma factor [Bryobacteraceae bacterium]|nr:ECF-type sigma factor [Bryobacteraceae bacterium]
MSDTDGSPDITLMLAGIKAGDQHSHSKFINAVYGQLKRIAANQLRAEQHCQSLPASALVNEAYLRMMGGNGSWENRAHFFASAASTMRRILIDRARSRRAQKRQGDLKKVELNEAAFVVTAEGDSYSERLLAVDEALNELSKCDPRKAKLVEMRFFTGMTLEEAAHVLGISSRTAIRDWKFARAWLLGKISGTGAS